MKLDPGLEDDRRVSAANRVWKGARLVRRSGADRLHAAARGLPVILGLILLSLVMGLDMEPKKFCSSWSLRGLFTSLPFRQTPWDHIHDTASGCKLVGSQEGKNHQKQSQVLIGENK